MTNQIGLEDSQKNIEENWKKICNQTEAMGDQLKKMMDDISKQLTNATDKVIITEFSVGDTKKRYETKINAVSGNVTTTFEVTPTGEGDIFWKLHMKLVDEALATRKDLEMKIIETVGTTIKGLFNPISVSNIDLVQIIQAMLTTKK